MDIGPILLALEVLAVASSFASLFTKDNLYSALYLAVTSGFAASILLTLMGILPFVLIVMIFIGATVTIVIVLAATYRGTLTYRVSEARWIGLMLALLIILLIALSPIYGLVMPTPSISPGNVGSELLGNLTILTLIILIMVFLALALAAVSRYIKVTMQ